MTERIAAVDSESDEPFLTVVDEPRPETGVTYTVGDRTMVVYPPRPMKHDPNRQIPPAENFVG